MLKDPIVIREAEPSDMYEIRRLAHAEGCLLSNEQDAVIDRIYVLTQGKRVLGALCGNFTPEKESVAWLAVHPMYPKSSLGEAMLMALRGINRCPGDSRCYEKVSRFSLKQWFNTVSSYIKVRGVIHGISGQQGF